MNLFDTIIALVLFCAALPFIIWWWGRLGGLKEEKELWPAYLQAVQLFDPKAYRAFRLHLAAGILWFDLPLRESYLRRSRSLRKLLEDLGRDPGEAPEIWKCVIASGAAKILKAPAPEMLSYYERKKEAKGGRDDRSEDIA